ncbi:39S ribosomal protein L4, mitochondrial-like [Acanthaster planci]|uniref:Large ribosomal subunit protein uL4m n=1 Tax=Acanthaster planci TaxID=133434 RepID=A0A8B7XS88_ACAPL|nr:39S ribosomal protein L4, mitochondrial-like [Acanthaster planci]
MVTTMLSRFARVSRLCSCSAFRNFSEPSRIRNSRKSLFTTAACLQQSDQGTSKGENFIHVVSTEFENPDRWQNLPLVTGRSVDAPAFLEKPQAWLETISTLENIKLGMVDLHPEVFATMPRIDILYQNVLWQRDYKRISLAKTKSRAEVRGGGRKPWRQKGTGRARHGSIRSPIWRGGGRAKGPRGPRSFWYELPVSIRAQGLRVSLTVKLAQDNLHIVDSLELPSAEPQFLEDVGLKRHWGGSVLFVDNKPVPEMPENFLQAVSGIKTYNVLSTEGINVYSMLKHHTLVLTLDAAEFLEQRLLFYMRCYRKRDIIDTHKIQLGQLKILPSKRVTSEH